MARVGRHVVPLVINDGNGRACYATSPSGFYVDYASDFVAGLEGSLKRWALLALLGALGAICRRLRMDRVVYLNNWLLPTQPAWALTPENTRALIHTLLELLLSLAERPGQLGELRAAEQQEHDDEDDDPFGTHARHAIGRPAELHVAGPPRSGPARLHRCWSV